ncbi:hypothetical protein [Sutcliffiella horikoshii]|uniref:hypothetical protein n=1 Tax=Sutcliffiella horikoshii TaxID=79883 RepID=UPI0012F778C1|nr:hypothetical protein [Sutcliffiella horikoshii]
MWEDKSQILYIKLKITSIIGMLEEDSAYTKDAASNDLKKVLRLLDEMEPKI